ncbi:hypothetical protein CAAN1_14S00166 [[Candida] anglica]|uniref:Uncharacterized protein n=1 Tax=[Candida] anglica TaxID=148631 RepID=A0ABP0ELT0_9ASCO
MMKLVILTLWMWLALVEGGVVYKNVVGNILESKRGEVGNTEFALQKRGGAAYIVGGACIGAGLMLNVVAFTRKREDDSSDDKFAISVEEIRVAYGDHYFNVTLGADVYKVTPITNNKNNVLEGAPIVSGNDIPEELMKYLDDGQDYAITSYRENNIGELDKRVDILLGFAGAALVAAGMYIYYLNSARKWHELDSPAYE